MILLIKIHRCILTSIDKIKQIREKLKNNKQESITELPKANPFAKKKPSNISSVSPSPVLPVETTNSQLQEQTIPVSKQIITEVKQAEVSRVPEPALYSSIDSSHGLVNNDLKNKLLELTETIANLKEENESQKLSLDLEKLKGKKLEELTKSLRQENFELQKQLIESNGQRLNLEINELRNKLHSYEAKCSSFEGKFNELKLEKEILESRLNESIQSNKEFREMMEEKVVH